MAGITLAAASTIVDAALAAGCKNRLKPLAVVVLDVSAKIVAMKREDNTGLLRGDIAHAKAWSVLAMGYGGRELERRYKRNPMFFGTLTALGEGKIVPAAGGVLIRSADGEVLGSVGTSGDSAENDDICSCAGIVAANLIPDNGGSA